MFPAGTVTSNAARSPALADALTLLFSRRIVSLKGLRLVKRKKNFVIIRV